jgi:FkbM family methyltransferase
MVRVLSEGREASGGLGSREFLKLQSAISSFVERYNCIKNSDRIAIFGSEPIDLRFAKHVRQSNPLAEVVLVSEDAALQGETFEGFSVFSLEEANALFFDFVIVNNGYGAALKRLERAGVDTVYDLHYFQFRSRDRLAARLGDELFWLAEKLADRDSIQILHDLLDFVVNHDSERKLKISKYSQYRHPRMDFGMPFEMIDAGACIGSNVTEFRAQLDRGGKMICLEPDQENFNRLSSFVANGGLDGAVRALNVGAWSSNTTLSFKSSSETAHIGQCRVSDEGGAKITTRTIDDICSDEGMRPTFIKMDIEGAEPQAILGAQQVIKEYKPMMAICLYHFLEDLWVVPGLVESIRSDYSMYIGHHHDSWWETVLYCV